MKIKFHKVIIYYFSGTGNAKNTAFWIGDEVKKQVLWNINSLELWGADFESHLGVRREDSRSYATDEQRRYVSKDAAINHSYLYSRALGLDVEIINIAKIQDKEVSQAAENTLIGFVSPTHGFHFPEIMRRFISRFSKVKNCSAFIVNTRAGLRIGKVFLPGLSGVLHYWSSIVLKGKGFKIVGLLPVDLPSNWLSVHPTVRKKGVELMYQRIEPKVRRFATKILEGKTSYSALYDIIQDTLIAPISILYIFFGRYFFAKSFIASSACDRCGLCEKTCPVQAIKQVDNRMFWTIKCESCMKCMSDCPEKAIETAHGFIIAASIIFTALLVYLINHMLTFSPFVDWQILRNENIKFVLISILFFPLLFIGYSMMHWLMRFKLFERIFVLSALTKYNFWGRYKAPNKRNKTQAKTFSDEN